MVDPHIHFLPDLVFSHAAHASWSGRHDDPRQEQGQFEDVTTGAHNDLQRATDIARAIVSEYGMGETLGQGFWGRYPAERSANTKRPRHDAYAHDLPPRRRSPVGG